MVGGDGLIHVAIHHKRDPVVVGKDDPRAGVVDLADTPIDVLPFGECLGCASRDSTSWRSRRSSSPLVAGVTSVSARWSDLMQLEASFSISVEDVHAAHPNVCARSLRTV